MKRAIVLSVSFMISQIVSGDTYPGDATYSQIVQEIYHEVSSDSISMTFQSSITTRNSLCETLVTRHNTHKPTGASQTNATYIGVALSEQDCLNALWFSSGYNNASEWGAWAGVLSGTWFNGDGQTFTDPADWKVPHTVQTANPSTDLDNNGGPRIYDIQSVLFSNRTGNARFAWNMSHKDIEYVWGWDAKDNNNQNGRRGAHIGWTFEKNNANCIIWVTPEESFLECVKPICSGKRRVSTGLFGIGQWEIGSVKNCHISPLTNKLKHFSIPRDSREFPYSTRLTQPSVIQDTTHLKKRKKPIRPQNILNTQ